MRIAFLTGLPLLLAASPATGQTAAVLQASDRADGRLLPYRTVELLLRNGTGQVVRGVALRLQQGGPTFLAGAAVPPGATQTVFVPLPPLSAQQAWRVRLLPAEDADAPAIAEVRASLSWDPNHVEAAKRAFHDPDAYRGWDGALPAWPAGMLRQVFLAAVVFALGCGAAMLPRRPAWRLAGVASACAAAVLGMVWVMSAAAVVLEARAPSPSTQPGQAGELLILSCRRTTAWSRDGDAVPVYYGEKDLVEDDLLVHVGRGVRVTLAPDQVRVFRTR